MIYYTMPDWLRIVLLILTCISFMPQLCRLTYCRGDASGINLAYVLLNLVAATELFSISFLMVMPRPRPEDINDPREFGDWINFANITIIWILWLLIFIVCIACHWPGNNPHISHFIAFYAFWLMISVTPVLIDAIVYADAPTEPFPIRVINLGTYITVHLGYVMPIIPVLALVAFVFQTREVLARSPESGTGTLSIAGVALQAIVFGILAATWYPGRTRFNEPSPSFLEWYRFAGFLTVNHALFALEQTLLLAVVGWQRWRGRCGTDDIPETQPLIGS